MNCANVNKKLKSIFAINYFALKKGSAALGGT